MTSIVDLFPEIFRKKGRRELLILAIAVICYLLGLLLVTEVSHGRQLVENRNFCASSSTPWLGIPKILWTPLQHFGPPDYMARMMVRSCHTDYICMCSICPTFPVPILTLWGDFGDALQRMTHFVSLNKDRCYGVIMIWVCAGSSTSYGPLH